MPSPNKRKRRKSDEQGVVFQIAETHKVIDWDLTTIQANAAISHSGLEPHLKPIMEQFLRAGEAIHTAHIAALAAAGAAAAAPFVLPAAARTASCDGLTAKFSLLLKAPFKKHDVLGPAAGNPAARLELAKMIYAEANSALLDAFSKAFAGHPDLARLLDGAEIRQFLKTKQVPDPGPAAAPQEIDVSIFPAVDVWYKATLLKGSTSEATTSTNLQSLMAIMQDLTMPKYQTLRAS